MIEIRRIGSIQRVLAIIFLIGALSVPAAFADHHKATEKSLYDRLGGLAPISVVVSDFLDLMVPDAELNKNPAIAEARKHVPAEYLKFQVTAQVCEATGGPCKYTGRSMKDSHAHLNITPKEWDRGVTLFKQVLAKHKVPEREQKELLAIFDATRADIVTTK